MNKYHKILTVFKRDPETKFKTLLEGEYATPEFKYLASNDWVFTEKIDGTNIRVMNLDGHITFGGKTDNAQIPAHLMNKLIDLFPVEKFEDLDDMCLYGEGYGAKIQKGGGNYIPDGCSFILFDVKCGDWWLKREDVEDIASRLGIEVVPIIDIAPLARGINLVERGFDSRIGTQMAEGLVMRPEVELVDRAGRRIITKIKHKDFNKK